MVKVGVFQTNFYTFKCDADLLQITKKHVEVLNWRAGMKNEVSGDLHNAKAFSHVHAWMQDCVNELRQDLKLPFDDLPIIQSWANKSHKGMWHHGHKHDFSFLSGIFYLNTSESGRTWFSVENVWFDHALIYFKQKDSNALMHKEKPEAGKLILFPSHIHHSVEDWQDDQPRYTIAFNTFPCGNFGIPDEKSSLSLTINQHSNHQEELF